MDPATPHRLVVYAYPGVELLDVAGPVNVFSAARRLGGRPYTVELVSDAGGPVSAPSGLQMLSAAAASVTGTIDTLLVPGGMVVPSRYAAEVRRLSALSERILGVCAGALLLADAGLLAHRRAATHWASCDELRRREPACEVDADAIYVRDGEVWTSAGVTAGIDLALAVVEEDSGPELARTVAQWLVMHLRRHGGQSQFSPQLVAAAAPAGPIQDLLRWLPGHLEEDLRVPALAKRAAMSPRNFARVFRQETGFTPADWVERLRVEAVREALAASDRPIKQLAAAHGFASVGTLHRAFVRRLGVAPGAYRKRFGGLRSSPL